MPLAVHSRITTRSSCLSSDPRRSMSEERFEHRAIISGIGQSDVGRRLNREGIDLTVDAALEAIADAGLKVSDIDGLATYPGAGGTPPGFGGPGSPEVQDAMRLRLNWHQGGIEGPAQMAAVIHAASAVACGLARHVLCYRTVTESTAQGSGSREHGGGYAEDRRHDAVDDSLPAYSAACWLAMNAQRHFHEFGTTREQLGMIPVVQRRNAALNPKAVYRDPMTLEDYLNVRIVSTPFGLYDCDAPVDGSTAVIVSARTTRPMRRSRSGSRPSAPRCGEGRRGTSSTTTRRCQRGTRQRCSGSGPTSSPPTSTSPSSTTGSRSSRCAGSRPSASASTAKAVPSSKAATASHVTARSRSTPTAASCRPAASTASGSSTRPHATTGRWRRPSARQAGRGRRRRQRRRPHRRRHAPHNEPLTVCPEDDAMQALCGQTTRGSLPRSSFG